MDPREIAAKFGISLDEDRYLDTAKLLSEDCVYDIGSQKLYGPKEICNSYEQNMLAGRKKLDVLEWGKSRIESLSESEFYVHFTDYLTHKGESYTHTCKQKLSVNSEGKIFKIEHIHDQKEKESLNAYYRRVGLPESK